jgi:NAD(P)-dependent dehydrogenase (short-subunit alcohol dehydrogenase family)
MMTRVLEEWGSVDILVNNAGIILQASAMAMTEQQWDKILGNNLKSCFLCSGQTLTVDGGYLMDGSLPGAEYWK